MVLRRTLLLLVTILTIFAFVNGRDRNRSRRLSLTRRTQKLERDVVNLKMDVAELKEEVEYLNSTLYASLNRENNTVAANNTGPRPRQPGINSTRSPNSYDFQLIEVKRTHIGQGRVNYTVQYSVNSNYSLGNLFSKWSRKRVHDFYPDLLIDTTVKRSRLHGADIMTSIVTEAENETTVMLHFGVAEVRYELCLNNSKTTENISMSNTSLPCLDITPGTVVYTIGENASLQALASQDLRFVTDLELISDYVVPYDNLGNIYERLLYYKPHNEYVQQRDVNVVYLNDTVANRKEANITLNMERWPTSGVMILTAVSRNQNNTSMLNSVKVSKRFGFHPSNQSRTFINTLFTFDMSFFSTYMYRTQICDLRAPQCRLRCPLVVGSNQTEMTIWRRDDDGKEVVMSKQMIQDPFFLSKFDDEVPRGVNHFFCNATKVATNETLSSEEIFIDWQLRPRVVSGTAHLIKNGALNKTIEIACVVRSIPVKAAIVARVDGFSESILTSPTDKIQVNNNTVRAHWEVTLPDSAFHQPLYITCYTESRSGYDEKQFQFVYDRAQL